MSELLIISGVSTLVLTGVDNSAVTFKNEAEWLAQRVVHDVHCACLLLAPWGCCLQEPSHWAALAHWSPGPERSCLSWRVHWCLRVLRTSLPVNPRTLPPACGQPPCPAVASVGVRRQEKRRCSHSSSSEFVSVSCLDALCLCF